MDMISSSISSCLVLAGSHIPHVQSIQPIASDVCVNIHHMVYNNLLHFSANKYYGFDFDAQ